MGAEVYGRQIARQKVKRLLAFLRLTDCYDSNLSLTNIALMVVIGKVAFNPNPTLTELGVLLMGLLNYNAKKYLNLKFPTPGEPDLATPPSP